jgi:type IV pilus assembly protein PilM
MGFFGHNRFSAGLDIGSGFVKHVVIDHSRTEPAIVHVSVGLLQPDAIVEGEVMDPAAVTETIRSVVDGSGAKTKDVVAAVGGHDVIIKNLLLDRMKEADAREVIRWEAEQHVPFDMENVQLDFQILDPESSRPKMQVLLVAAKRELIESRMTLLSDAGLTTVVLDVDAFALCNAFEHNYPGSLGGVVALINVGHDTTNVILLEEGAPILVRDIPLGARRLRASGQHKHSLTANHEVDVPQGDEIDLDPGTLVDDRVDELVVGVERAIAFVQSQNGGQGPGRVFVSGGGACLPGLIQGLANRLGVRTEAANPLLRVGARPEVMEAIALDELAPMLMLPVGLALRGHRGFR